MTSDTSACCVCTAWCRQLPTISHYHLHNYVWEGQCDYIWKLPSLKPQKRVEIKRCLPLYTVSLLVSKFFLVKSWNKWPDFFKSARTHRSTLWNCFSTWHVSGFCVWLKVLGVIAEYILMVQRVKAKIVDTMVKVYMKLHSMSKKRHLKKTSLYQDIFQGLFFYFPFPNHRSLREFIPKETVGITCQIPDVIT